MVEVYCVWMRGLRHFTNLCCFMLFYVGFVLHRGGLVSWGFGWDYCDG